MTQRHWEVVLRGPEPILEELTYAFRNSQHAIVKSGEGFVLRSSRFGTLSDAANVRLEARPIVEALSGISRVLLQSKVPLGIASLIEVTSDGTRNIFVELAPETLRITAGLVSVEAVHSDGSIDQRRPSDPAPTWLLNVHTG
jgi:hypothetical protein